MTMKITRLTTHWQAEQADTVIRFLDEIRTLLCETYGDQISEMHRREAELQAQQNQTSDAEDNIDF